VYEWVRSLPSPAGQLVYLFESHPMTGPQVAALDAARLADLGVSDDLAAMALLAAVQRAICPPPTPSKLDKDDLVAPLAMTAGVAAPVGGVALLPRAAPVPAPVTPAPPSSASSPQEPKRGGFLAFFGFGKKKKTKDATPSPVMDSSPPPPSVPVAATPVKVLPGPSIVYDPSLGKATVPRRDVDSEGLYDNVANIRRRKEEQRTQSTVIELRAEPTAAPSTSKSVLATPMTAAQLQGAPDSEWEDASDEDAPDRGALMRNNRHRATANVLEQQLKAQPDKLKKSVVGKLPRGSKGKM
jgi:hypothetical protein